MIDDFVLVEQAAALTKWLAFEIAELVDAKTYAEKTYDLDTFVGCHYEIARLERIYRKADARYNRRLSKTLVAA